MNVRSEKTRTVYGVIVNNGEAGRVSKVFSTIHEARNTAMQYYLPTIIVKSTVTEVSTPWEFVEKSDAKEHEPGVKG